MLRSRLANVEHSAEVHRGIALRRHWERDAPNKQVQSRLVREMISETGRRLHDSPFAVGEHGARHYLAPIAI